MRAKYKGPKYIGMPITKHAVTLANATWCLEELTELVAAANDKDKDGVIDAALDLLGAACLLAFLTLGEDSMVLLEQWMHHQASRGRSNDTAHVQMLIAAIVRSTDIHKSEQIEGKPTRLLEALDIVANKYGY